MQMMLRFLKQIICLRSYDKSTRKTSMLLYPAGLEVLSLVCAKSEYSGESKLIRRLASLRCLLMQ